VTGRVAWLDCAAGVSGDMLLGALTAVGAVDVPALADALGVGASATVETVTRAGIRATQVHVHAPDQPPHRRLDDVLQVIATAQVPPAVRERAEAVFRRLAAAEAQVHGVLPEQVEFHEVGAVDAIVDVVGACAGLHALGVDALLCSPIALGGGTTRSQHGPLPVPGPAVLALLAATDLVARGGPVEVELATPTGVAVLAEWARPVPAMPALAVDAIGAGAGGRDLTDLPNVLRLVVGTPPAVEPTRDPWHLLETNVDDLDPRLWPGVLERLLAAGAADAWLTPILMKKGRPAHTLSALVPADCVAAATDVVFAETSAIGVRSVPVAKTALARTWVDVDVDGQPVRVKVASRDGHVLNVAAEWEDVARAAAALGRPVKSVLAVATAAAYDVLAGPPTP
jgi:uncharacterized protein (TIGR00299 family) protein